MMYALAFFLHYLLKLTEMSDRLISFSCVVSVVYTVISWHFFLIFFNSHHCSLRMSQNSSKIYPWYIDVIAPILEAEIQKHEVIHRQVKNTLLFLEEKSRGLV